ncbi:MAG: hypothetical protein ABDH31_02900 [Chlorobiota bacterium]
MRWLAAIAWALLLGCGKEPFYDSAPPQWRFLLLTDASTLQVRQEPGGQVLLADAYGEANGTPPPAPIRDVVAFRNSLYLLLQANTLAVLDAESYRQQALIPLPAPPAGLAFPNATTGYVWHDGVRMLSILDLLQLRLVRTLPVPGTTRHALPVGPLLYMLEEQHSRLLVLDTRTERLVDSLELPPSPRFAALRANGTELVILSAGSGDDGLAPRAPRLSFVGLSPLRLLASLPVYHSVADSARTRITGLVTTADDFAFIGTSQGLLRVDIRSRSGLRLLQRWSIRQLRSVPARDELWVLTADDTPKLIVATGTRAEPQLQAPLPVGTVSILPLP